MFQHMSRSRAIAGGPGENESLSAWRTRLQKELESERQRRHQQQQQEIEAEAEKKRRAEAEEAERAEQERAEASRQEVVWQAGDIGVWLRQDLGFDYEKSVVFGTSLRARNLHNAKAVYSMDEHTLESVLGEVEMPNLLSCLVMEAWRRRRKVCSTYTCAPLYIGGRICSMFCVERRVLLTQLRGGQRACVHQLFSAVVAFTPKFITYTLFCGLSFVQHIPHFA